MNHVAPKNFKRGRLIGNKYRPIDLVIAFSLITFSVITVLSYAIGGGSNFIVVVILLIPCLVAALILVPLDFHHNLIQRILLWVLFISRHNKWTWQGIYHYLGPAQEDDA